MQSRLGDLKRVATGGSMKDWIDVEQRYGCSAEDTAVLFAKWLETLDCRVAMRVNLGEKEEVLFLLRYANGKAVAGERREEVVTECSIAKTQGVCGLFAQSPCRDCVVYN